MKVEVVQKDGVYRVNERIAELIKLGFEPLGPCQYWCKDSGYGEKFTITMVKRGNEEIENITKD